MFCLFQSNPQTAGFSAYQRVYPVARFGNAVFFSAADKTSHHADDICILNAVLLVDTVIAEDDITVGADFNNSVQDILVGRPSVKHDITGFTAAGSFFGNDKHILSFAQQGKHTDPDIGIGKAAVFFPKFLIADFLIHSPLASFR